MLYSRRKKVFTIVLTLVIFSLIFSACDYIDYITDDVEEFTTTIEVLDEETEEAIDDVEIDVTPLRKFDLEVDEEGELEITYEAESGEEIEFTVSGSENYEHYEGSFTAGESRVTVKLGEIIRKIEIETAQQLEDAFEDEDIEEIVLLADITAEDYEPDDLSLNRDIDIYGEGHRLSLDLQLGEGEDIDAGVYDLNMTAELLIDNGDGEIELENTAVRDKGAIENDETAGKFLENGSGRQDIISAGSGDAEVILRTTSEGAVELIDSVVDDMIVAAAAYDPLIDIDDGSSVDIFTANSAVKVLGSDKINIALVKAENVVFESRPKYVDADEDMEPTIGIYTIYFKVSDSETETPVEGAEITLKENGTGEKNSENGGKYEKTDSDGQASFSELEPEKFTYEIERDGYESFEEKVEIVDRDLLEEAELDAIRISPQVRLEGIQDEAHVEEFKLSAEDRHGDLYEEDNLNPGEVEEGVLKHTFEDLAAEADIELNIDNAEIYDGDYEEDHYQEKITHEDYEDDGELTFELEFEMK